MHRSRRRVRRTGHLRADRGHDPAHLAARTTAAVTLGQDVPLRLATSGSLDGLEARAIVHASLTSRTGFERSLNGDRLGSTIGTTGAPAATLPFAPTGGRILTLKLQDPNLPRDTSRLRLPLPRSSNTGVYPVEIELRDPESGERVASFVTQLVAVAPGRSTAPRWVSR